MARTAKEETRKGRSVKNGDVRGEGSKNTTALQPAKERSKGGIKKEQILDSLRSDRRRKKSYSSDVRQKARLISLSLTFGSAKNFFAICIKIDCTWTAS